MRIPVDSVVDALKMGASVQGDVDAPVRVAVYLDEGAPSHIVSCLREALVPQTTSGLVRVARLDAPTFSVKADSDVALVVSSGSALLQDRVQQIAIAGVPTVVLCESSVEAPFIQHDTAMLGLIAASDATHLLSSLARWILDRTDKDTAFAANFPFMRISAAMRVVRSATMANLATGALFFMPGADFPVMTMTQLGMMLKLAAVFGKPMRPERAYEAALVLGGALAMRAGARAVSRRFGRPGVLLKVLVAGAGTFGMGCCLSAYYERDVDYAPLNDFFRGAFARAKSLFAPEVPTVG